MFNDTIQKLKHKIILKVVSSYIKTKKAKKWVAGKDWIHYSGPFFNEKEYTAAITSLLSEWLILGETARKFETKFAPKLGKKDGVVVNSGSSANLLMLAAMKSKRLYNLPVGSKFITPVLCFPTTLNPIIQNGFEPVFVDVTLPSLNLDLDQVEAVLKLDTAKEIKGIIFAHVLGNPPDMDRVMRIVKEYNLIFLEDACDALGSTYKGQVLGSFGHLSSCSFFPAHHMTMGEGGFVGVNTMKERIVVSSLRDWGRACHCNTNKPGDVIDGTACGNRFKCWFKGHDDITFDHRYVFDEIGYNLKPIEMQTAIGLEQIDKLDEMHAKRKKNHARLCEIFYPYRKYLHMPLAEFGADVSWFGFLLTIKDESPFTKDQLMSWFEHKKVQTRSYFTGNALLHPAYVDQASKYVNPRREFPVATKSTLDSFFLGVYPGITDEQLDYIEVVVERFMRDYFVKAY